MIPFLVTFTGLAVMVTERTERLFFSRSSPPRSGRSRARRAVTSWSSVDRRVDQWNRRGANPTPTPSFAARGHRRRSGDAREEAPKKERHPSGQSLTVAERKTRWAGAASAEIPPAAA